MKVLILAAGRSKRMKPIADKNFLNFLGRPLIEWQITQLWENGFKEVILVGGKHNLEALKKLDNDMPIQIDVVEQKNLNEGMRGAVLSAEKLIGDDDLLVLSSNDVVESMALELVKNAMEHGDKRGDKRHVVSDGFVLAKKVSSYFPGGYLKLDDNGYITGIVEKPAPGKEPSDLVNIVVHYFKNPKKLIKCLKTAKSEKDDLYEVGFDKMIREGARMLAIEYDGYWQPIKYPWHVMEVFKYLFNLGLGSETQIIAPTALVSDKAFISGPVIIDENSIVMAGATIKGPCYIGRNSIIATNALVRESNIGSACVIGFSTEVARSYLGDNVWTHSNYIGDSVIGNDVGFGAGTVTGNLRLDEGIISVSYGALKVSTGSNKFGLVTGDHIRVGVNTSFMPGVKLGGSSFVGAGLVVAEDIPDGSFVKGSVKLSITKNKGSFNEELREKMRRKL